MKNNSTHIDILDGFRGLAILMVVAFHTWQMSWLNHTISFGGWSIDLNFFATTGFLGVELFFFISGFCIFLPHARHMVHAKPLDTTRVFYFKRLLKIVPSYILACILILLFLDNLVSYPAVNASNWPKHVFTHLFFIHNLFPETYSSINGLLWSLGVEVQFYYLFPVIAWFFRRKPGIVFLFLLAVPIIYRYWITQENMIEGSFYLNQLVGLFDLFAFGMLAAYIVEVIHKKSLTEKQKVLFTVISVSSFVAIVLLLKHLHSIRYEPNAIHIWQANMRTIFGLAIFTSVVAATGSMTWWKKSLANPVLVFFSKISYNWYIWHIVFLRLLLKYKIPQSSMPDPHNDIQWQLNFTIATFFSGLIFAAIITYVFEVPILNRGKRWLKSRKTKRAELSLAT